MYVTAYFTDGGIPATGLTPTIRIRDLSDNSLVITDASMTEVGDGHYKYNFAGYDKTKEYTIRCDGGATLGGYDRYTYGINDEINNIESIVEENSFYDAVFVDTDSGNSGTVYPNGTPQHPVNNLPDAKTIADARSIKKIEFLNGSYTLTEDMIRYIFKNGTITLDSQDIDQSEFIGCTLMGVQGGGTPWQTPSADECLIVNITNLYITCHKCILGGNITLKDNFGGVWYEVSFALSCQLNVQAPNDLKVYDAQGEFTIVGMDGGTLTIFSKDANITIDNTCTAGTLYIHGTGYITDNSNGTTVIDNTLGNKIERLLGLTHENVYSHTFSYDSEGRHTGNKMDLYDTKANALTHDGTTGIVAKYTLVITYTNEILEDINMVRDS